MKNLKKSKFYLILSFVFLSTGLSFAEKPECLKKEQIQVMPEYREGFKKNCEAFKKEAEQFIAERHTIQEIRYATRLEANYILQCQYIKEGDPASGAINDVYGDPTWVVPRENALAILGLLEAYRRTGNRLYLARANLAADYLVRIQDSDGAWYNQYGYTTPGDINNPSNTDALSKSPTQTAEVMMAFYKMGYEESRYEAMKKGAEFLIACQDPANKTGADDGLICGGKDAEGNYSTWRWCSDNCFAYQALKAAAVWAKRNHDKEFAKECETAAAKILEGINQYFYIRDTSRSDFGVWYRVLDANDNPIDSDFHEWINYAPQMLDLPAEGVGNPIVGEWIHNTFQQSDGSVVWNDGAESNRKSPGYSFQAMLVWKDLGQYEYARSALTWAVNSGLWQKTPDSRNVAGGWIDWIEGTNPAPDWQRFIDTSFYFMSAIGRGYNFICGRKKS